MTTHAPTISRWLVTIHDIRRYRYRLRCTCGHKGSERADVLDAEVDQRVHLREVHRG